MKKHKNKKIRLSDKRLLSLNQNIKKFKDCEQSFSNCLVSLEDLAQAFHLTPQTLRNWIALRKIPSIKIGRKRFFLKKSLEKWLNQKEESTWR